MKPQPAYEITPDHQISPPAFAQGQQPAPPEVIAANREAAAQIDVHKDAFIRSCLESLYTDEEIGQAMLEHLEDPAAYIPALIAKLDPSKLKLTLRDDFAPTLILPTEAHPEAKRQKALTRQTGHTLHMTYDDRWLGTMEITYENGRIRMQATLNEENQPEP